MLSEEKELSRRLGFRIPGLSSKELEEEVIKMAAELPANQQASKIPDFADFGWAMSRIF
jgi:hypothetical protein